TILGLVIQLVTRQLLGDELGVGLVLIERLDHVVAIAPRVGAMDVVFEPTRVGVARDVEPGAAIALAVVRRREQLVDEMLPRIGTLVRQELGNFGRRRRTPEK